MYLLWQPVNVLIDKANSRAFTFAVNGLRDKATSLQLNRLISKYNSSSFILQLNGHIDVSISS